MRMRDVPRFFGQFLRNPGRVGAIAPSSRWLARAMVDWVDWSKIETVVEYGPGTGIFTAEILRHLPKGARFFAIELNERFADDLERRFPRVRVYRDHVGNLGELCQREGVTEIDLVISGLPWAAFSDTEQTELLDKTIEWMAEGGHFATFAYLQGLMMPAGKRFRQQLDPRFREVRTSPTVWRNLPPAVVYCCRR